MAKRHLGMPTRKTTKSRVAKRATPAARITLPKRLKVALGDDPVRSIAELVRLRKALGAQPLEDVRSNPFLDVRLDAQSSRQPFATSTIAELRSWRGTERALVDEALRVSGRSLVQLAHSGLMREAATELQNDFRRRQQTDSQAPGRGSEGVRDQELLNAVERLKTAGKPISASTLRRESAVAFRTCASFLKRRGESLRLILADDGRTWAPAPVNAPTAPSESTETVGSGTLTPATKDK